jgi:hypothetical protein
MAMSSTEQREHARFPKTLSVDVHVFVLPASQTEAGYEAHGRTVNIGRGGVLMQLDKEVPAGVRVRLRFWDLPPGVRLWPLMISGTIVRLEHGAGATRDDVISAGSMLAPKRSRSWTFPPTGESASRAEAIRPSVTVD